MRSSTARTAQREQEAAEQARLADTLHRPERADYVSVTRSRDPFAVVQPDRDLTLAERTF